MTGTRLHLDLVRFGPEGHGIKPKPHGTPDVEPVQVQMKMAVQLGLEWHQTKPTLAYSMPQRPSYKPYPNPHGTEPNLLNARLRGSWRRTHLWRRGQRGRQRRLLAARAARSSAEAAGGADRGCLLRRGRSYLCGAGGRLCIRGGAWTRFVSSE